MKLSTTYSPLIFYLYVISISSSRILKASKIDSVSVKLTGKDKSFVNAGAKSLHSAL